MKSLGSYLGLKRLTNMNSARARNWCFTLNNYTEEEITDIKAIECKYILFGKEVGANGTKHLQGYIEFDKPIRFGYMKKLIPRAHLEVRTKPREANLRYCKKDGDFFERSDKSDTESPEELGLELRGKPFTDTLRYYWNGAEITYREYHWRKWIRDMGIESFQIWGRRSIEVFHEDSFMRHCRQRNLEHFNELEHWNRWNSDFSALEKLADEFGLPSFSSQLGWEGGAL